MARSLNIAYGRSYNQLSVRRSGEAGGVFLKRDRKKQLRDYSKFDESDKEYYGLFHKKDKLRIDVKRLAKSQIVPSEMITYINNIPRNTVYFFPEKKKRSEYSCNIPRDDLDSLLSVWNAEIYSMTKKIRTPGETEHRVYVNYMSNEIIEHDEAYAASKMDRVQRIKDYILVFKTIYGQYIHFIGSTVEYSMVKV